ncbi:MAG: DUF4333 domain-containing protein [Thermoleophilia bacterium]|nr:DUF4333 domain-containing protein [Thermoleophilia bacterium]
MISRRTVILAAASALATLTLAGCSFSCSIGEKTASSSEMNSQLTDSYEQRTGIPLTSVDCPEVKAEVGEQFSCTGTNERDIDLDIDGKVTSADEPDDKIKFRWNVVRATAPGELYSTAARKSLERQSGRPLKSVTCPDRIPIREGAEVHCTVETADGEQLSATLTLTDLDGGFRINVDQSGSVPADTSGA